MQKDLFAADIVLKNGKIVTLDDQNSVTEAVAIKDGKIVTVGTSNEIERAAGRETTVIDLDGRIALPGFYDSHVHLAGDVEEIKPSIVECRDMYTEIKSIADIQERMRLQAQKTPKGEWVIANGSPMQDGRLREHRFPTRWDLDEAVPNHPAFITFGAHRTVANSLALKMAGISENVRDPPAGKIVKDANGEPNGMLVERAQPLVTYLVVKGGKEKIEQALKMNKPIPGLAGATIDELKESIVFNTRKALERGATTIHDIVVSPEEMRAYQEVYLEGKLPIRVGLLVRVFESDISADTIIGMGLMNGFGNDWLKIVGAKMSIDGGITGLNSAFYDHYVGQPDNYGQIRIPQETLNDLVMCLHKAGLRCAIHALGDKAFDMVLQAYEKAIKAHPRKDHRHRIEHQPHWCCLGERIKKVKELDLVCSVITPTIYLGDTLLEALGPERMKDAYAFKTYMNAGIKIIDGTDAPGYWPVDPLRNIQLCVTRKTWSGIVLNEDEALSVLESFRMVTTYAAWAAFEEDIKGSIETGKLADLVILAEDPFSVSPDKIKDIKVDYTILDGKIAYQRGR